jgi:hypothetical protein
MKVELLRVAVLPEGAFGVLKVDGRPVALALERTYKNLEVKIPAGSWRCVPTVYHKGRYPTWEILVPGHSRLLFHRGNWETDLDGCIAVARSFEGTWVSGSRGFEAFERAAMPDGERREFMLEVRDAG